jgi:monoamine oxidase
MGEALATVLSPQGAQFVIDVIGYDSGPRALNIGDAIPFLLGGGNPSAVAVTPNDGMSSIPRGLIGRFEAAGGKVELGQELLTIEPGSSLVLHFASGLVVEAERVVVSAAIPGLERIVSRSPSLPTARLRAIIGAVEAFPAFKLYMAFDEPWWRPSVEGIRLTTDLAPRKIFYLDSAPDRPAALLAAYTDGLHTGPWRTLSNGLREQTPVNDELAAAVRDYLVRLHPSVAVIPRETASACMFWGADENETGWSFWRAGYISDDVIDIAVQPDARLQLFLCGEAFSHEQSWVEGAIESADRVVNRIVDG